MNLFKKEVITVAERPLNLLLVMRTLWIQLPVARLQSKAKPKRVEGGAGAVVAGGVKGRERGLASLLHPGRRQLFIR